MAAFSQPQRGSSDYVPPEWADGCTLYPTERVLDCMPDFTDLNICM